MDFQSLEESKGQYSNRLVMTDHFIKLVLAYLTRTQEARTVVTILFEQFVLHYGIPEQVHSDQGGLFDVKVIKHLCEMLGISKSQTSPYHPMGDMIMGRFNRTLLSMLRTLEDIQKMAWKEHVAMLVHA